MAYHSEVLQRERDLLRKSHLSPAAGLGKELQGLEGETVGLRRAGGGVGIRFSRRWPKQRLLR